MSYCRFKEQDREEYDLLGPPHPGEILREDLCPRLKMSRKTLARQLGVSTSTVSRLLKERCRVSAKVAMELARLSGSNTLYWLLLQAHHDAWNAERARELEREMHARVGDVWERPIRHPKSLMDAALID
jgi:addiction module HigA family antidote